MCKLRNQKSVSKYVHSQITCENFRNSLPEVPRIAILTILRALNLDFDYFLH